MFEGTSIVFKILYFLTAMCPAYLLFLLQMHAGNDRHVNYLLIMITVVIEFSLGLFLVYLVKKRRNKGVVKKEIIDISNKNGDIITYLFGVIVPSVLQSNDNGLAEYIIVFLVVQITSYIIIMKSTSILPNVVLLLMGMNIYLLNSGIYVLSLGKKVYNTKEKVPLTRLGDDNRNNVYIIF